MTPLRRAICALAALAMSPLMVGVTPALAATHAPQGPVDSSSIQLTEIAPAVIPAQGVVALQGTLHNGSGETWHHVKVVPATSRYPLTTSANLASAATLDPSKVTLGSRLPQLSTSLPDLAPGASVPFTVNIPRDQMEILGTAGVYWLSVTPVSDEAHPRELTARTFLPLPPQQLNPGAHLNISLVVPLRSSPLRIATGALADPAAFTSLVSDSGRLGRILSFAQAAGDRPLTWLVDPALLDLASDDVSGSVPYPVGAFQSAPPTPAPLPSASPNASTSPTNAPSPNGSSTAAGDSASPSANSTGSPPPLTADQQARLKVRAWLDGMITTLGKSSVYALPYADPSVAALVGSGHSDILTTAVEQSAQSMTALGLETSPAVAPTTGALSQAEWSALAPRTTAFVNPSMVSTATAGGSFVDSRTVVIASDASSGGPGPADTTTALNLRQRLLSEAVLLASTSVATDLTVVLPATWDPGTATADAFFAPLTQPWISFTGLATPTSGSVQWTHSNPQISADQRADVDTAIQLQSSAAQLMSVIAPAPTVASKLNRQLRATELSLLSAEAEAGAGSYRTNAAVTSNALRGLLDDIRIEGSEFVTLSGSSGIITISLENDLNVPIKVGVRQSGPTPRNPVTVAPVAPITLDPGERSTLRVHLNAPRVSVQEVTVTPVSADGVPVGTPLTFTVRSSPVGTVVWAITIALALMITLLVGRSVLRRLRAKREPGTGRP